MTARKYLQKEKIDFKYNLKTYWEFLRRYKAIFFFIIFLVLIIEVTHTLEKYFFKIIVDRGTDYSADLITLEAFGAILFYVALAYIVASTIKIIAKWVYLHWMNRLDGNIIYDLKEKYFNHIVHLSHGFHTTHKTGSLIARLNRGASAVERMTDFFIFNTAPLIFQIVIVAVSLIYFDIATGIVVLLTAAAFIVYSIYIQQIQNKSNLLANKTEDIEKGNISDIFTNIDSIKYFGKENVIKQRYARLSNSTKRAMIRYWDYFRWFDSGQSLILAIGTFFLIYFPIKGFLAGDISLGTLVFVYTVYGNLFGPLFGFVHSMRGFYRAMADFEDLFRYGKIENEIKDRTQEKLDIKKGEIEFKHVSFNYAKRQLFKDFNLRIEKGEKVALVGHSGSGKTTLVKLLYRLYDVSTGQILVDGKNIKDFKQESLRSELSIVPQECVLFDDTIYNNIAFSSPKASREEVMQAMKFAQLDKIVNEFPLKENTVVGERGVKLSGGEKQRVSIARAILANKKVLVLDEATSSLDSKTEHDIQKDLQELMKGRTSIIIAHRLSTIMKADKIVVMDKGKIVQMGKHSDLINKPGTYRELWSLQKGGYIEE